MDDDVYAIDSRPHEIRVSDIGFQYFHAKPRRLVRLRVVRHDQPPDFIAPLLHLSGDVGADATADASYQCLHAVAPSSCCGTLSPSKFLARRASILASAVSTLTQPLSAHPQYGIQDNVGALTVYMQSEDSSSLFMGYIPREAGDRGGSGAGGWGSRFLLPLRPEGHNPALVRCQISALDEVNTIGNGGHHGVQAIADGAGFAGQVDN